MPIMEETPPTRTPPASAVTDRTWLSPKAALWFWNNARKVVVLVIGLTVVLIGVALLILPGPGWLIIFGGVGLLATEFAWARWLLKEARRRYEFVKNAALKTWTNGSSPVPPKCNED